MGHTLAGRSSCLPGPTDVNSDHQLSVQGEDLIAEPDFATLPRWAVLPQLRHPDAAHVQHWTLVGFPLLAPSALITIVAENRDVPKTEPHSFSVPQLLGEVHCADLHLWGTVIGWDYTLIHSQVQLDVLLQLLDGRLAEPLLGAVRSLPQAVLQPLVEEGQVQQGIVLGDGHGAQSQTPAS